MEERINRRGCVEHFVSRHHLKLNDLKAFGLPSIYLYRENIPEYPKPEIRVCRLKHETTSAGLAGIRQDEGFRDPFEGGEALVWWSLSVGPEEITSAETRLLEETFPDRQEEQQSFLWKFTSSPAFLETSRLGSYRFTFPLEEVLTAYSQQFCSGEQPVMRIYETVLYKQEVMYVVLVHSPANNNFERYPLLPDDPDAICSYRDGCFIWRPEAMSGTHCYELVHSPDRRQMEARGAPQLQQFYVWDHFAVALHVGTQILKFNAEELRNNLKFCDLERKNYSEKQGDTFEEAKERVRSLWPDWPDPLEAELSLQQSLTVPDMKLVLVGRPGEGKTSVGDIILGRGGPAAGLPSGPPSGTTDCSLQEGRVFHWKVTIIDTPGLLEPCKPAARNKIFRCINMTAPAPSIIILVLRLETFSAGVRETMNQMEEMFAMNVWRRTVVLFTYRDQADAQVQRQLQKAESELWLLFRQVCRRYQVFNISPEHEDRQQVWDLLYTGVRLAVCL